MESSVAMTDVYYSVNLLLWDFILLIIFIFLHNGGYILKFLPSPLPVLELGQVGETIDRCITYIGCGENLQHTSIAFAKRIARPIAITQTVLFLFTEAIHFP